jgi:hypothetical protein
MTKKTKVVVKSTIAAALAATAVVPVIAAPASAAAAPVTEVVYVTDGKNVSLSFETFTAALNAEVLTNLDIKYVKAADGNYYTFADFSDALNATETLEEALQTLADNAEELAQELTDVVEGTVGEDGNVKAPAPVDPQPTELAVESVSAINTTTAKVTFNKEVEALDKAAVVVTQDGTKVYVKSVTLSEDKKSATVEFYNTLTSGKTYDVEITVGEAKVTGSFDFVAGVAKTIELAAQSVVAGEKLAYKVLDANGLDITAETTVEVATDVTGFFTPSKGQVLVAGSGDATEAFAKLTVKGTDGKVIAESAQVKVKLAVATPTTVADYWTLKSSQGTLTSQKNATGGYDSTDFKQDNTVNLNSAAEYLNVSVLTQFGKDPASLSGHTVKYESLDTDVAIIDAATGKVTPRKAGSAPIKVTLLKGSTVVATQIVELTVAEKAEFKDLSVSKEEVSITTTVGLNTETVVVKGLDQFGDQIARTTNNVTAVATDATIVKVEKSVGSNGAVNVKLTALKAGTTTVTVTSGEVTKTITVSVAKAGEAVGYEVQGAVAELLYADDLTTKTVDETQMTVKVKGVDAEGLATGFADFTAKVTYKNADGETVEATQNGSAASGLVLNQTNYRAAKGDVSVKVYVGTLEVGAFTFKVTDNRELPTVTAKDNKITLSSTTVIDPKPEFAELLESILEIEDGFTYVSADFLTSNETVIDTEGTIAASESGSTTIYVNTVTVKDSDNEEYVISLGGEAVTVTVDNTAPTLASKTVELVKVNTTDFVKVTATLSDSELYYTNGTTSVVGKLVTGTNSGVYAQRFTLGSDLLSAVTNAVVDYKGDGVFEILIPVTSFVSGTAKALKLENPSASYLTDAVGNKVANIEAQIKYTAAVEADEENEIEAEDAKVEFVPAP